MAFDQHTNFAVSTVAVLPSPAASGTSLTVASGEGARFPAAPFNATIGPIAAQPTPANAEIVRVTARTGDVFTLARAQEGTTARTVQIGDLIAATITAKTLTDIETTVPTLAGQNVFTGTPQNLTADSPAVIFTNTNAPLDQKKIRLINASSAFLVQVLNDAQTVILSNALIAYMTGDARVGRDLFEKGRADPMGHWIDIPFSAANFSTNVGAWTVASGNVSANHYTLIGKTLMWHCTVVNTTHVACNYLLLTIPGGLTALANAESRVARAQVNGVVTDLHTFLYSGTVLGVTAVAGGTLPAATGNTLVSLTATLTLP
jgi:hypothetical protein